MLKIIRSQVSEQLKHKGLYGFLSLKIRRIMNKNKPTTFQACGEVP